jgi:hypothetical protein
VKEESHQANGNNTDDTEDDNNTSLLSSPVLALGELVDDLVAGHERLDSGHYVGSGEIAFAKLKGDEEAASESGREGGLWRWEEQNKTEQLSLTRVGQLEFRRYVRV